MSKNLTARLKKLQKRIQKLEKALVAFPGSVDDMPIMRICREELGEKAVEVTVLSGSYTESELSMARRVARVLSTKSIQSDIPQQPVKSPSIGSTLSDAGIRLLVGGIALPLWREPFMGGPKKKARFPPEKLAAAKRYLKTLGIRKAALSTRERSLFITAGKGDTVKIAKLLRRIQKKMKSLGFSEVLLKPAS